MTEKLAKHNPVALITGASAGLGAEFARQLAHNGYNLVLTARRLDRLESLADELRNETGIEVLCISADLSDNSGIERIAASIQSIPDLEILINNAGFGLEGSFENNPLKDTLAMLQVHINASVILTHTALPSMRRRGRGWIINVSSMSAFFPVHNVSYSATKAFLVNFSEALETDLIGSGVHVQALCPGFTHTEFHDSPGLSRIRESLPSWLWMNGDFVVRTSINCLRKNNVIVIPGFWYKAAYLLTKSIIFSYIFRKVAIMILSKTK